jgi:chemosensory pili system protein ChpA (sensor histidine kinase/response regulator)
MSDDIMVDFLAEVEGYLPEMRSCLAHLHQEKNNKQALEELHRITHTIKGAAAMVGLEDLSKTGGLLEQLMDEILDESRVVNDGLLDFFSESTERLAGYCTLKRAGKDRTLFQETSAALEKQVPEQGSTDSIAEILDQLLSTEVEEDFFLLNETVEGDENREEEYPHQNPFFQQRKAGQAEQEETEEESGLLEELFGANHKEEIFSETENSKENQIFAEQEEQLEERAFFDGLDSGDDTAFLFAEDASEEEDIFSKVSEEVSAQEQEAIDPELLECFAEEADEHLSQIDTELNQLAAAVPQSVEISPPMREQLHVLRRAVHTLKGAAAVIGIESIAAWGRDFEDCLDWLHDEADRLDPETVLAIQRGSSVLAQLAQDPAASSPALIAEQKAVWALFQHIQTRQAADVSEELLSDSQEEDALPEAEEEFIEEQFEEAAFFDELAAEVPDAMEFLFAEESPAIEEGEEEDIFPNLPEPEEIPIQEESEQVTKEAEVAIDPELLECFTEEADEHLSQIDTELNQLAAAVPQSVDISPAMREHLHVLRRAVHTLKGAAAVIGIAPVAAWGHDFEDFLDWLHDEAHSIDPETILALRQGSDLIAKITEQPHVSRVQEKEGLQALFQSIIAEQENKEAAAFLFSDEEEEDIFSQLPAAGEPIQAADEAEAAIDPELLECFTEEADEHLSQIDTELNQLAARVPQSVEISPAMREHLHVLRRAVHTLKGAAAVIGIAPVAAWGHDFEDFLDWLHDEADRLEPETILALRQGSDLLAKITEQPFQDFSEKKIATITLFKEFMGTAALNTEAEVIESQQNEILPESQPHPSPEPPSSPPVEQEVTPRRRVSTLRVDVNKIDQVVGLSGDMVINLSSFESSMTAMSGTLNELGMILQRLKNINSSLEAGYELASIPYLAGMSDTGTGGLSEDFDPLELDRYSELNILIRSLSEAVSDLDSIMSQSSLENIAWQKTVERQARVLKEIQNRMIGIRMTPLSILATRMQRTVREAERTTGHSAELVLEGESIMMDTRVWDTMADPLMHILRNAVAHGGSPEQQDLTIRIKALRQGGLFFLRISDNGKGLNYEAIRKKGMKLYPTEGVERMRQEQLAALIFRHGFSSTSAVSNIAGRGVGMDVVRDAVEQLNGSIQIYSEPGQGLELLIRLPVAVAQLHVVMTRLAGQVYAVPMHDIDSVVRVHAEDLVDTSEYLTTQGERLPLLLPSNIPGFQIGIHDFLSGENEQALLLVHSGTYRAALLCDQILGQRDVVFKDLGAHLSKVPCIAGVTIMGDGRLIPILQTEDLLKKWQELSQAEETFDEGLVPAKPEERPLQILVVDDSISVRKVVSNFILQQGWQPIAARNGIEALERIREEKPDFVLLDVEMPRMNGFEVLQSLQSQPDFRDIPVAMLTSRSAEKYREKARQLGARGFVTKPFKAEEIFDLIHRLTSPEKENV